MSDDTRTAARVPLSAPSREHFDTLAALYDAATFHLIEQLGIKPGWRCWEVGAGGWTVPRWLAENVGPIGRVLATDLNTANLETDQGPAFEVLRHDLTADVPPLGEFDLVHARLVLDQVRDREAALATMVGALRPGGWLLVEVGDNTLQPQACPDETGPAQALANKVRAATWSLNAPRGRTSFGRTLPRALREAGLVDVRAEVRFPLGGPDAARLQRLLVDWAKDRVVAAGLITQEEADRHLADIASGRLDLAVSPVISAWGRTAARVR